MNLPIPSLVLNLSIYSLLSVVYSIIFTAIKKQYNSIDTVTPSPEDLLPIDTGCAVTDTDTCAVGRSPSIGQKYGYMDVNLAVDGLNDTLQEELLCQVC